MSMLSENPREKKRSLFFLTGLVLALSLVIVVMQSSTVVKITSSKATVLEHSVDVSREMPVTVRVMEKKPEKKLLKNLEPDPHADPDPILQIPKNIFGNTFGDTTEAPVAVGVEPGLEDPDPVPPMFLEFIAVPTSCQELNTKEEKMTCMNAWINSYLRKNLRYPSHLSGVNISDKVILSFVVSTDGQITEVEVLRGEYEELNREAVRALESMPDWIPARQFTRNVPMRMVIPVHFSAR